MIRIGPALLALPLTLAACDDAQPPAGRTTPAAPAPVPAATPGTDYLGRWVGVEGMFLTVTPAGGSRVTLEMQWDLDHRGTFPGTITPHGIRFVRAGREETAVPGDGDATGLKWLAGKRTCLIVKPGEGYCRA